MPLVHEPAHIHDPARPCAYCLAREGKQVPDTLLVPADDITQFTSSEEDDALTVATLYSALPTASQWLIWGLIHELATIAKIHLCLFLAWTIGT